MVAWLVADNVLYTFASLSKKSVRSLFADGESHVSDLPIGLHAIASGTLD